MPDEIRDDEAPSRPKKRLPARAGGAGGAGGLVRYDPLRAYMADVSRYPVLSREEEHALVPAVASCRDLGIDVSGPFPADTVFHRALEGEFDCVVAMYHDQGLIPIKLLAWREAVNLTLGLPIIRTSPDHGTAFDIAGKGIADATSMVEALKVATSLAAGKGLP